MSATQQTSTSSTSYYAHADCRQRNPDVGAVLGEQKKNMGLLAGLEKLSRKLMELRIKASAPAEASGIIISEMRLEHGSW